MADDASDAIVCVLAGEVAAQVGKARARMRQWESLLVPAEPSSRSERVRRNRRSC